MFSTDYKQSLHICKHLSKDVAWNGFTWKRITFGLELKNEEAVKAGGPACVPPTRCGSSVLHRSINHVFDLGNGL